MMMKIHCFQRSLSAVSSPLVPIQLPSRMEAHIWYILPDEVKSAGLLNQYSELLTSCERENVLRMKGEQLQKRALLARALVRTTIARYQTNCNGNPRSLKFRKNIYGKPEVVWQNEDELTQQPLHFNISHTSSLIACGVTLHSQIGIDVEEKARKLKNNILAFAGRYFSPSEVEVLSAISDPEIQRQEFIKLWTLKEAYVKALGRGFSASPFNTFTIRLNAGTAESRSSESSQIIVESSGDTENLSSNWSFALVDLAGSHYAAVCMENEETIEKRSLPMKLRVCRTIPFVEDECISGTGVVLRVGGSVQQL